MTTRTGAHPGYAGGVVERREVHLHSSHYLPALLRLSPRQLKHDVKMADTFNAKVAVILTRVVGTMWCFWVFNGIALVSLPTAIHSGNLTVLINWVSSNWIQLILLPALMVGQNLQSIAADARSARMFDDIEKVKADMATALDRLDTRTQGGLKDVLDAVERQGGAAGRG
jgi:hypothetical protein